MRILIITSNLTKGGSPIVIKNICPILMEKHHITIMTNDQKSLDIKCNKLIQLKSTDFPFIQYKYIPELKKIVNQNKLKEFDIIHIFDYPHFGADYLTYKKNKIGIPMVLSTHGSVHQFSKFPLSIFKKIHNSIMSKYTDRISQFLAITEAEKNHLIQNNILEKQIKIVRLGVNSSHIEHKESPEKTILYLGRLSKTKNVEILVQAFSKINDKNVKLVLAGPDFGMKKDLEKIIRKQGIGNRVIFTGEISEEQKNEYFSKYTVFVHPSLEDIFSLALIEAAAAGIPTIAFDVEGNSEILEDGITGKLVKNPTQESLKESIELLLNNKELRVKISQNASTVIPEKFNWKNTAKSFEKIYIDCINEDKKL